MGHIYVWKVDEAREISLLLKYSVLSEFAVQISTFSVFRFQFSKTEVEKDGKRLTARKRSKPTQFVRLAPHHSICFKNEGNESPPAAKSSTIFPTYYRQAHSESRTRPGWRSVLVVRVHKVAIHLPIFPVFEDIVLLLVEAQK